MKYLIAALLLFTISTAQAAMPVAAPVPPAKFKQLGGGMPSFRFQDINGAEMTLDPYLGQKVLIVNFWATWCPPCVKEMPSLDKLADELPKERFKVIVIAEQTETAEVSGFFKRANLKNLAPYMDPQMAGARALGLGGLPSTVIVGPNGIIGRVDGELDWAAPEIIAWLKALG